MIYASKEDAIKGFKDELKLRLDEIATSTDYLATRYEGTAKAQWRAYKKALQDVADLIDKIRA